MSFPQDGPFCSWSRPLFELHAHHDFNCEWPQRITPPTLFFLSPPPFPPAPGFLIASSQLCPDPIPRALFQHHCFRIKFFPRRLCCDFFLSIVPPFVPAVPIRTPPTKINRSRVVGWKKKLGRLPSPRFLFRVTPRFVSNGCAVNPVSLTRTTTSPPVLRYG